MMFARTERLLLRPGWAEDAPALAAAIADEMIVRNLATAPWPYRLRDAEAFLAQPRDPVLPSFLIFAVNHRPVQGAKGTYRVTMRHGVSPMRSGSRHTLGIILHDAA